MGEAPSKLFHAIVGLGLAAAGCGEVLARSDDAGDGRQDVMNRLTGDAGAAAHPDATMIVDAGEDTGIAVVLDAMTAPETGADVEAADAARAHDAAMDVTRPPPPEIK